MTVLLLSLALASDLVAPAVDGHTRESPLLLEGDDGRVMAAVSRNHPDRAGEIAVHVLDGSWSAAGGPDFATGNLRVLADAGSLDGRPTLVLLYDDTDYTALFDAEPGSLVDSEVLRTMDRARQVFLSVEVDGDWIRPQPIAFTRGARSARLIDGSLLLVCKDGDGDWETLDDTELYALRYVDHAWGEALRLTEDALPQLPYDGLVSEGGAFAAWAVDADADPTTLDDREIWGARPGEAPTRLAGPFRSLQVPEPHLVERNGDVRVLWSTVDEGSTLYERGFDGGEPEAIFAAQQFIGVRVLEPDRLALRIGDRFYVAEGDDEGWSVSEPFFVAGDEGLAVRDWDASLREGELHLLLTGRVGPAGRVHASDGEALFHHSVALEADPRVLELSPLAPVQPGAPFPARLVVRNQGTSATEELEVHFEGAWPSQPLAPLRLLPGELRTIDVELTLDGAIGSWAVEVGQARFEAPLPLKPDFQIVDLWVEEGLLYVDARERNGLLVRPVPLQLSIQTPAGESPLGEQLFDPRDPALVTLELPELEPPYRVLARINPRREPAEASYLDNEGSYQVLGKASFRVHDSWVEDGQVQVVVRGEPDGPVALLLTSDPSAAARSLQSGWEGESAILELVDGEGSLSQPLIAGDFLYAVVNPGQAIAEDRRSDNTLRFSAQRRQRVDSELVFTGQSADCGALVLHFENRGAAPSLAAYVTLEDQAGLVFAELPVPKALPGEAVQVRVEELPAGRFEARLSRLDRPPEEPPTRLLQAFDPSESLDADADGFVDYRCGGEDCPGLDGDKYPGSPDWDEDCREKVKIGCERGCSGGPGPTWLGLLAALALGRRRQR